MRTELTLAFDEANLGAVRASITSLEEVVKRLLQVGEVGVRLLVIDFNGCDLATLRATDAGLTLEPTDLFRELLGAVSTLDLNINVVEVPGHNWPILSSVCCSTTMAEGAALSRRGPGSAVFA